MGHHSTGGLYTRADLEAEVHQLRERYPDIAPYFGVDRVALSMGKPWAAYVRQSAEKLQAGNNAVPEYLMTCAAIAREKHCCVPMSLIFYDTVSGKYLDRPELMRLRDEYIVTQRVGGVLIPHLDRMSRGEASHLMVFEYWCERSGVEYWYGGGVPNGTDENAKAMRRFWVEMAAFQRRASAEKNLEGRKGRLRRGLTPTCRPPLGYAGHTEVGKSGRVEAAWWTLDTLQPGVTGPVPIEELTDVAELARYVVPDSPAWVVCYGLFRLVLAGATFPTICAELNDQGRYSPDGKPWMRASLRRILLSPTYTGTGIFNRYRQAENPASAVSNDITARPRLTVRREKDPSEFLTYQVPALITTELHDRAVAANESNRRKRGHARPTVQALLRGHILCPACHGVMRVNSVIAPRRKAWWHYYRCARVWEKDVVVPCDNKVLIAVPKADNLVRELLRAALADPEELLVQADRQFERQRSGGELPQMQLEAMQREVERLSRKRRRVMELYTMDKYETQAEFEADLLPLDTELARARELLTRAEAAVAAPAPTYSKEYILWALRTLAPADVADFDKMRWLLDVLGALFVPELGCKDGHGNLYFTHLQPPPSWFVPGALVDMEPPSPTMFQEHKVRRESATGGLHHPDSAILLGALHVCFA